MIYLGISGSSPHGFGHVYPRSGNLSLKKKMRMKKTWTMAFCLMALGVFAQKPEKGNVTTELGLSLGTGGNTVNTFGINGRYFYKPDIAFVLGLSGSYSMDVNNYAENGDGTGDEGTFTYRSRYTEISLGVQKHFAGTSRLSPFIGADLLAGADGTNQKGEDAGTSGYIKNYSYEREAQSAQVGIRATVGFDFWVTNGLYVGALYRPVSLILQKEDDTTTTSGSNGSTIKTVSPGGSFANLNTLGELGSIRVGWLF
ncbi:MAG: hypothetical protein EBV15_03915 [Bacteroidetes bacterium]|jgi:hypothetical protein|nr:hypothetical protein [Bacteroidota bacterium]